MASISRGGLRDQIQIKYKPLRIVPRLNLLTMPNIPLPTETIQCILSYLHENDVLSHHRGPTPLFNCTLASRHLRAVALPMIWRRIRIFMMESDISVHRRLLTFLTERRSTPTNCRADCGSYVVSLTLSFSNVNNIKNHHEAISIVRGILGVLSSTQLRDLKIILSPSLLPGVFTNIIQLLFPGLTHNLRCLDVSGHNQTEMAAQILHNLPATLQELRLSRLKESEDPLELLSQPEWTTYFADVASIPVLHGLTIDTVPTFPAVILEQGLRRWGEHMQYLTVTNCHRPFPASVIHALADGCPNLRKLMLQEESGPILPGAPLDVNDALCTLVSSCRRLERLNLHGPAVSERFLAHCAEHASSCLRGLIVYSTVQLTGEMTVDVGGWSGLEKLVIMSTRTTEMDPAFVKAVRAGCERLKHCYLQERDILCEPFFFL